MDSGTRSTSNSLIIINRLYENLLMEEVTLPCAQKGLTVIKSERRGSEL